MKKEWYLQKAIDERNPKPFWDSYIHRMCEVIETSTKDPFKIKRPLTETMRVTAKDLKPNKKDRTYFLDEAEKLINGPRAKEYGPAKFNHERIAKIWSVILAREVTAQEVVACMVGVKLARLAETIEHDDSWVDIIGYAALGGEIINDK
tara:strand:+ start:82 stop:528 length:447 start_codon:yes stop_codon:yes gene_type:complete